MPMRIRRAQSEETEASEKPHKGFWCKKSFLQPENSSTFQNSLTFGERITGGRKEPPSAGSLVWTSYLSESLKDIFCLHRTNFFHNKCIFSLNVATKRCRDNIWCFLVAGQHKSFTSPLLVRFAKKTKSPAG